MNRTLAALLLLTATTLTAQTPPQSTRPYTQLYVFGDSYSDTGAGYIERGFVAEDGDLETLTTLLGHAPRRYIDFARESAAAWQADSGAPALPAAA